MRVAGTRRNGCQVLAALLSLAAVSLAGVPAAAQERGTSNLVIANDLFAGQNRYFTSGVRMSWLTSPQDAPSSAVVFARALPLFSTWDTVRAEYVLDQDIFTPNNKTKAIPNPNDQPYAGWLYAGLGLAGESGPILDQIGVSMGVIGPAALAKPAYELDHSLRGFGGANGFKYQLKNEPTAQLFYQRSWRGLASASFGSFDVDVTPHAGFAAGNVYDYANAGLVLRFGPDLSMRDYGPPPVNLTLPGAGFFIPSARLDWYLFAGADGRAVARNIFLDGNTFRDSRSVDKKNFVADLTAGFSLTYGRLHMSYTHVLQTPEFADAAWHQFGELSGSIRW